jgi:hypothetical protein
MRNASTKLSAHEVRRISVAAGVDPRSVQRVLRGESVRPMCAQRIADALAALGLAERLPPPMRG